MTPLHTRPRRPRTLHPVEAWSKLNPGIDFDVWKGRCYDYRNTESWCEAEKCVDERLEKYRAELSEWASKHPDLERMYQDMRAIERLRVEDEEIEDEIREARAEIAKQQTILQRKSDQRARIRMDIQSFKSRYKGGMSLDVQDESSSPSDSDEE